MFKAGLLTVVNPPNEAEEALRDLVRARECAKRDLLSARHRVSKMLLRNGMAFTETKNWTVKHRAWLKRVRFEHAYARQTFDTYLLAMEQIEERLKTIDGAIEEAAQDEAYAEPAGWLRCLKGVNTVTAMTILAELHDFGRFTHPRELMSYLGLTPSEYSSGGRSRRGGITKTGNGHVRRVLIEAAWNYRHRPSVSVTIRKRREGQPVAVIAIADQAQQRLHKRYRRLKEDCGKPPNVVSAAIAREFVGFIWAVLNHQQSTLPAQTMRP
jgi:transposase